MRNFLNLIDMKKVARPIFQYDLNGNFILRFPGAYQAAKDLGINPGGLHYALQTGNIVQGKWRFKYEITKEAVQNVVKSPAEFLELTPIPILEQMAEKGDVARLFVEEPDLKSEIDFTSPVSQAFDSAPRTFTNDEPPMYQTVEPEDRWLTPFERILKRKGE
jgi:hypothetical protein